MSRVIHALTTLERPRRAGSVTLVKAQAIIVIRHESLVDFVLGSGGGADSMAEYSTLLDVEKVYELIADNKGEDFFPDLSRKPQ